MRTTYAIEAANKLLTLLAPSADQATRAMLVQDMLPNILQFQALPNVAITLEPPAQEPEQPESST